MTRGNSLRLRVLGTFVDKNSVVFDVGADHGFLEKFLISNKLAKKIYAIENKEGPYRTLLQNIEGLENVVPKFSDGIDDLEADVNTLVLAGIGGANIINIVSKHLCKLENIKTVITDAHKDDDEVRKFFVKNGFKIDKERIVYENHIYYVLTKFVKGKGKYSDLELEFGVDLMNDEFGFTFFMNKLINFKQILKKLNPSSSDYQLLQEKIERLDKYINGNY